MVEAGRGGKQAPSHCRFHPCVSRHHKERTAKLCRYLPAQLCRKYSMTSFLQAKFWGVQGRGAAGGRSRGGQERRSRKRKRKRKGVGIQTLMYESSTSPPRPHNTRHETQPHNNRVGALVQSHPGDQITPVGPGRASTLHGCLVRQEGCGCPDTTTTNKKRTAHSNMVAEQVLTYGLVERTAWLTFVTCQCDDSRMVHRSQERREMVDA